MVGHGLEVVDGFGATRLLQHFDLGDSAEIGLQAFTALRASDLAELSAAVSDPQAERGGSFGGGLEEYEVCMQYQARDGRETGEKREGQANGSQELEMDSRHASSMASVLTSGVPATTVRDVFRRAFGIDSQIQCAVMIASREPRRWAKNLNHHRLMTRGGPGEGDQEMHRALWREMNRTPQVWSGPEAVANLGPGGREPCELQGLARQELQEALQANTEASGAEELQALQRRLQELALKCSHLELQCQDEGSSLEGLKEEEEQAQEALRLARQSELTAKKDSELLRQSISELRAQCEGLPSEPAEEVVLRGLGLPRQEQSLQEIMERLKMEKDFVLAELMEDEKQLEARRRAEELSLQLKTLEEAQPRLRERAAKVEQEKSLEGDAISGLEDLRAEAIALQTENQLLKRQQVEWRRSQTLMLRLAEDMQKRPPKATPDDEGLDAEEKLEEVLQGNQEMRRRIQKLQNEKEDLLQRRRGLDAFIRSRVPRVEMGPNALAKRTSSYPPSP
ncbi:unnamed protein product [Durusdinium trenchii]|uniref:Uncharacterized protein n=1 Tax=Durusdinium trenchii TaxID=1381693 RepID=A0ABP0P0B8_9DINO